MPLTGGVKSGIAVTPAVIVLFANLACLQFGSPFPLRNKHPVKLISVAALAEVDAQMNFVQHLQTSRPYLSSSVNSVCINPTQESISGTDSAHQWRLPEMQSVAFCILRKSRFIFLFDKPDN